MKIRLLSNSGPLKQIKSARFLSSFVSALLGASALTVSAQPRPTTVSENWTGAASDGRWDNPANWFLSQSQVSYVPNATTSVNYVNNTPATINLTQSGASNTTFSAFSLQLNPSPDAPTLNLNSTGTGIITLDITGDGIINASGGTNNRFVPNWVINVGKNGVLKFSKAFDDGTNPVAGGFGFINLIDNGVLDISAVRFGTGVTRQPWDFKMQVEARALTGAAGTKIILGENTLRAESGQFRDGIEIASNIDASGGGRISKGGGGYLILSGNNTFTDTLPAALHDEFGFVITNNTAAPAINNVTRQNEYINNRFSLEDGGLLIVNSRLGPVRIAGGDGNTLGGLGTVGSVLLTRGVVAPGFGRNSTIIGTLTVDGNFEIRGTSSIVGTTSDTATLHIDLGAGGVSDKLVVKGRAYIGASDGTTAAFPRLVISSPTGSVMPGRYTFLTADKGIVGEFNPQYVTRPTSLTITGAQVAKSADGRSYGFTLTQKPFVAVDGLTSSQQVVASYLDYMASLGNPSDAASFDPVIGIMNGKAIRDVNLTSSDGKKTYDTALGYNPPETLALLQSSMNQLTPQSYVHLYEGAISNLNSTLGDIERHTDRSATRGTGLVEVYTGFNYGSVVTKGTLDYEEAKLKTYYYTLGADKFVGERLLVGANLTFSDGRYQLDSSNSSCDVDSYTLNAYSGYNLGKISFGGALFLGTEKYKVERSVEKTRQAQFVTSKTDGARYGAGAWANYSQELGWFVFKPYGGLYWMNWSMDGFTEKGNSSTTLVVGDQSYDYAQSKLGLRAESSFFARNTGDKLFRSYVDVSWLHILTGGSARTVRSTLQGYAIDVRTPSFDADGTKASAGIASDVTKRLTVDLGASWLGGASVDHGFNYQTTIAYRF
jgi:uncharacterized protein YhjY with autotransporter beta-barrel domain